MKHLWAAWRMKYINKTEPDEGCVFCNAQAKPDGPQNLIVARGEQAFVILNKFPYTSGHVMVVPVQHADSLELLDPPTRAEMMELVSQATAVLRAVYKPQGFNIGMNIGAAAGAGVPGHVHIHIVPRWGGDTNFMSTVGEVRVLPEELDESYRRIKAEWLKTLQTPTV
ncbi:MAG: HIT domain-containing protein [Anaerolineales bacterium]|jgi:ATP adenylyltransferase|nr:HIT domain-containing protein [Anaerolineales bacterium]